MSAHSGRIRRHAFTLLELIVVIAVLGILALILIPVVAKIRASAQSTHCMSNLQQIGRAFTLYAEEHRSLLPAPADVATETYWFEAIHTYSGKAWDKNRPLEGQLAEIYRCPTLSYTEFVPTKADLGYAMSAAMKSDAQSDPNRPVPLSALQQPSRTILALELTGTTVPYFPSAGQSLAEFSATYTAAFDEDGCDRHAGAANYLFADGHVGHHSPTEAANFLK